MKYLKQTFAIMTAVLFAFAAFPVQAQEEGLEREEALEMNERATQGNEMKAENAGWITLIGTIQEPQTDSFQLEVGDARLTVEMNDFRSHRGAAAETDDPVAGDSVVVSGPVDAELFSNWTLKATEIHFSNLSDHMKSAAPGMDHKAMHERADQMRDDRAELGAENARMNRANNDRKDRDMRQDAEERKAMNVETARGTITTVNEASNQFTVDTGDEEVVVKTDELDYNPFTGDEDTQITVGDVVVVTGHMTRGATGEKHLQARQVVSVSG